MGSLIVLLVVVVQQAKTPTEPQPVAAPPMIAAAPLPQASAEETIPEASHLALLEKKRELEEQLQDLNWGTEQVVESREKTRERLETSRLNLSRLEDQARTLESKL
jgi:hypothetical protein